MISFEIQKILVPALGFGTWKLSGQTCVDSIRYALDIGYRHIDTAQIYENETEVGTALKDSGIPRSDIFLTTKVWMSNVSEDAMHKSVEESLRKLKTDYVDMLLIHWPVDKVPFSTQLKALTAIQKAGQAKLIGVSNFTVAQMREVVENLGVPITNNQVEYHPYLSQKPVLDYIRNHNMFLTAYSPLARGKVNESSALKEIGLKYNKTPGQVTLRWLIQQGSVAAIPKAASRDHIQSNFNIFDFALNREEIQEVASLARADGRMVNPDWAPLWDKAA